MKQSIKSLAKTIKLENAIFDGLTKARKRVKVAQDCIFRIKAGQLLPEQGRVIDFYDRDTEKSLKDIFNKEEVECQVCAKGGLFVSYVGRTNKFTVGDIEDDNSFSSSEHVKLLEIFSARQLSYIEFAFEGEQLLEYYKNKVIQFTGEEEEAARDFYRDNIDDDERLLAICENIIKNKGTFKL